MAEQQDSLTDEQLDERVDALVKQMNEVSEKISRAISDDEAEPDSDEMIASDRLIGDDGADESLPEPETPAGDAVEDIKEFATEAADEIADAAPIESVEAVVKDEVEPEAEIESLEPATEDDPEDQPEEGPAADETGSLDDQVEVMLETALDDSSAAPPAADLNEVLDEPDTDPQAEQDPAAASADEPSAAPSGADAEAGSVEDLDAALADFADDLLEGDFDDVDAVLQGGDPREIDSEVSAESMPDDAVPEEPDDAPAVAEVTASDVAAPPTDDNAPDDVVDVDELAPAAESPSPQQSEAPAAASAETAAPAAAASVVKQASVSDEAGSASLRERVTRAMYDAAVAANRPLDARPTYMRDIVGWFAAVTLFNAVAVWAFWMLSSGEAPAETPADVVTLERPAAQGEPPAGIASDSASDGATDPG
jgi:pilus assembly protein FimV